MENINDTFFDGYYQKIWKNIIPEILNEREHNFLISYFNLTTESRVLDLMCGYGRHTIPLARKGVQVTAVDNLKAYTNEIKETAIAENLPIQIVTNSVTSYQPEAGQFDLALCMGNSLNFFDAADTELILKNVAKALKQGGKFLINSWSFAEIVFRSYKEASNSDVNGYHFDVNNKIVFHPTRMLTESVITSPEGQIEKKPAIDYIFSINEMEKMLNNAGLHVKKLYSIPGKKEFTVGEPRIYLVAEKA